MHDERQRGCVEWMKGVGRAFGAVLLLASALASASESAPALNAQRYDADYPTLNYAGPATHNAFARLQARLDRGELALDYSPSRGYLDALLKALNIDPSSQVLVYSKTSLQIDLIEASTPRAVYYNDEVYVGYVQNAPLLELAAMDSELGLVFYTLVNKPSAARQFDREAGRCLTCHDTYSMMGGGVPRVVVLSAAVDGAYNPPARETSEETSDQTPLRERWGGWYVTGQHGEQLHLGNLPIDGDPKLSARTDAQRLNLQSLDGLFNVRPYLTNKSDIVSLMVLEHQAGVQNLITRANLKVHTVLARLEQGAVPAPRTLWDLSPRGQAAIKAMVEPLVRTMLFVDAVEFTSPIAGNAGYEAWFQGQGPRDRQGRTLRELDLKTRLFRYPLSYFIYSASFDSLPEYIRQYLYGRFAEILQGRDSSGLYAGLNADDRKATLEILMATKPDFGRLTGMSLP